VIKARFIRSARSASSTIAASANRRFEFEKRSQLFIRTHNETLFRCRDARLQSRLFAPSRSTAAPTPTGFAEIVSSSLGIVDHVRRRFAGFKLCAHLLDLRCLLVQTRRHSFHSFLLLRDLPAEIGSCDLPEAE
jgi:hypothetical protein